MDKPKIVYLDPQLVGDIERFLVEIKHAKKYVSFSRYTELALRVLTTIVFNLKKIPDDLGYELQQADPEALEQLSELIEAVKKTAEVVA